MPLPSYRAACRARAATTRPHTAADASPGVVSASASGVDATTLTNWMKKRAQPDLRCLPRVIRWIGYDPRPEAKTIGGTLVRYREGKGASQRQLANALAVDPSTLARWEQGQRIPKREF